MDLTCLPPELQLKISSYLQPKDLLQLCHTNSTHYHTFNSDAHWKNIFNDKMQYSVKIHPNIRKECTAFTHCHNMHLYISYIYVKKRWEKQQYKITSMSVTSQWFSIASANLGNAFSYVTESYKIGAVFFNNKLIVLSCEHSSNTQTLQFWTAENTIQLIYVLKVDFKVNGIKLLEDLFYGYTSKMMFSYDISSISSNINQFPSLCEIDDVFVKKFQVEIHAGQEVYHIRTSICAEFIIISYSTSQNGPYHDVCKIVSTINGNVIRTLEMPDKMPIDNVEITNKYAFIRNRGPQWNSASIWMFDIKKGDWLIKAQNESRNIADCLICNFPTFVKYSESNDGSEKKLNLENIYTCNSVPPQSSITLNTVDRHWGFIHNCKRNLFIGWHPRDQQCFNDDGIISQRLKCNDIQKHKKFQYDRDQFGFYGILCNDDYFVKQPHSDRNLNILKIKNNTVEYIYGINCPGISALLYMDNHKIIASDFEKKSITVIQYDY